MPGRQLVAAARRVARPRTKSPLRLPVLAFFAAFAIVMVMVVDPYSGAYADAATAPVQFNSGHGQNLVVHGTFALNVKRGQFGVHYSAPRLAVASAASAPPAAAPDPGSAQAIAKSILASQGMGDDQYSCLVSLWNRESHWNVSAANPDGAYGIPQALPGSKMASAGPNWQTNARTQILWGLGYIKSRYGTPCAAWAHSQATGWY